MAEVSRPKKSALYEDESENNNGILLEYNYDPYHDTSHCGLYKYESGYTIDVPVPADVKLQCHSRSAVACETDTGVRFYFFDSLGVEGCRAIYLDAETLEWTKIKGNPTFRKSVALVRGGRILLTGGRNVVEPKPLTTECEIFNINEGTFEPCAPLPEPRVNHALIPYNRSIVAIGGKIDISNRTKTCCVYDALGRWNTFPSLSKLSGPVTATSVGDKIYAIASPGAIHHELTIEQFDGSTWVVIKNPSRIIWASNLIRLRSWIAVKTTVGGLCIYLEDVGWSYIDPSFQTNSSNIISF